MPQDIDIVSERAFAEVPGLKIERLRHAHAADDDGVWFIRRGGEKDEMQLESSTGDFPFLVETSSSSERRTVATVDEAVTLIRSFFEKYG